MGNTPENAAAGCPFGAGATKLKSRSDAAQLATFDPVKQKIDVTGEHAFRPPTAGDKKVSYVKLALGRVNAVYTLGTVSRWPQTPLVQAIEATNKVFGMGIDLATVLGFNARPSRGSPGGLALPPLLSAPQGFSGSHNKYEGDASATRADAYMNNGDANSLNMTYFKQLYNLQPEGPSANFDYDVIIQHRAARRQESVSTNPHFFNGPHTHSLRFMSNHSAETPEGVLNHDVLKSFYGVSGSGDSLTYQRGYEVISISPFLRVHGLKHPEFLSIGGNTGKVNSLSGVNICDTTGGVYNSVNLLEGNNLICFAFQAAQQAIPDILKSILGDLTAALGLWTTNITPILSGLGCPKLTKYDGSAFGTYPGSGGGALWTRS
ncbi:hypothetical protein B0J17DRAFT_625907 [Rhizoctonia solani]|nr:hypothetical protein B0J17DRAFT_625907 [Rhizoctonia solani]